MPGGPLALLRRLLWWLPVGLVADDSGNLNTDDLLLALACQLLSATLDLAFRLVGLAFRRHQDPRNINIQLKADLLQLGLHLLLCMRNTQEGVSLLSCLKFS